MNIKKTYQYHIFWWVIQIKFRKKNAHLFTQIEITQLLSIVTITISIVRFQGKYHLVCLLELLSLYFYLSVFFSVFLFLLLSVIGHFHFSWNVWFNAHWFLFWLRLTFCFYYTYYFLFNTQKRYTMSRGEKKIVQRPSFTECYFFFKSIQ